MVEIVFEHGGTLDKFMGDALMSLWGAPLARADDADRAIRAAVAMQRALERLNDGWRHEGRPTIEVGIGINVGEVFAGNIGSERRLEYTVIGDAVNIAARFCAEAHPGEILISDVLFRGLKSPPPVTALRTLATQREGPARAGLPGGLAALTERHLAEIAGHRRLRRALDLRDRRRHRRLQDFHGHPSDPVPPGRGS